MTISYMPLLTRVYQQYLFLCLCNRMYALQCNLFDNNYFSWIHSCNGNLLNNFYQDLLKLNKFKSWLKEYIFVLNNIKDQDFLFKIYVFIYKEVFDKILIIVAYLLSSQSNVNCMLCHFKCIKWMIVKNKQIITMFSFIFVFYCSYYRE